MKRVFKSIVVWILTREAKLLLRRQKPHIVAITGSVGKTATKDAVYAILKEYRSARKSEKSYNSDIGVPLSVLGLANAWSNPFLWIKNIIDGLFTALFAKEYPEILVLEMGVDRPGDMKRLASWIDPDVVVLTRLPDVPVHVEYFSSPEAVVEEKLHLVHALKPEGVLVYNNDDEQVRTVAESIRQKSIGYSRYSQTDFAATQDVIRYEETMPVGMSFTLTHAHTAYTAELDGCVGVQNTYSAAAAVAVASRFNISFENAVGALKNYTPPPGRMRLITGANDTCIIDDSYNASPVAMERAIATLKDVRSPARKIAVLGDMLELGRFSVEAHKTAGESVASVADILVTLGVRSRKLAESALAYGMDERYVFQYDDPERAARELRTKLQKGDVILVKASQSIRAEKLVKLLMENPEDAPSLLVRQGRAWHG